MADRRDAPNGEAGAVAHEIGIRLAERFAKGGGDPSLVHPVDAARDDQHRPPRGLGAKDERFGDLRDLIAGYEEAGGGKIDIDDARTWIVYGSLKWGVMCMSMYQGFKNDGSVERAAIGRRSSETEIDLVNLIIHGKM